MFDVCMWSRADDICRIYFLHSVSFRHFLDKNLNLIITYVNELFFGGVEGGGYMIILVKLISSPEPLGSQGELIEWP